VTKGGWARVQERVAVGLGGILIKKGHMVNGKLDEMWISSTILFCVDRCTLAAFGTFLSLNI
jgi:hypothetical protein